jgi:hypothetical protein
MLVVHLRSLVSDRFHSCSPERSSHRPCVWRKARPVLRPLTEVASAGDSGFVQTNRGCPKARCRHAVEYLGLPRGRWCASGGVATSGVALETMLAGGCATLAGSDSDGNQRARPSSERPLAAKAAGSSDGRESTYGWAFRVYEARVYPIVARRLSALTRRLSSSILLEATLCQSTLEVRCGTHPWRKPRALDERERSPGGRRIRAGCRLAWP